MNFEGFRVRIIDVQQAGKVIKQSLKSLDSRNPQSDCVQMEVHNSRPLLPFGGEEPRARRVKVF